MKRQKRLWTAAAVCAVLGAMCRAVPGVRFAGLLFWCLTALLIVFEGAIFYYWLARVDAVAFLSGSNKLKL